MFAFEKTNLLPWFFLEHIVIVCGSLEINHDLFYPQKIKKILMRADKKWQKKSSYSQVSKQNGLIMSLFFLK